MQKTKKAWLHLASRLLRSKKHLTIPPNHPTHTHTHKRLTASGPTISSSVLSMAHLS